jgi:hypothetical protein
MGPQVQSDEVIVKVSFEFFGSVTCMPVTRSEAPAAMLVPGIVCALALAPHPLKTAKDGAADFLG